MKSHYKKFLTYQNFLAAEFGENEYLGSNHREVIRQYSFRRNKVLIQTIIS